MITVRNLPIRVLPLAAIIAVAAVGLPAVPPPAAAAAPVEPEAPDFASEAYGDPWDFSNPADFNTNASTAQNVQVSGGKLQMDFARGESFDPVSSVGGSLAVGRDGAALPIDTSRYTRLSFSMSVDATQSDMVGALYWFTCREMLPSCAGGVTFHTLSGQNTYDLDLTQASSIGANVPWNGRMVALRILPAINLTPGVRTHLAVDWMRLHGVSAQSPHAANPPGDYGSYRIEAMPIPIIDSPVPQEGRTLAQAQGGSSWNFVNQAVPGVSVDNTRVLGYDSRGMVAVNANSSGDPQVHFPVQPFSANQFHWLTFDMTYDGPYDLSGNPGGGKLARVIWNTASTSVPQDSDDIVTYSAANSHEIVTDLSSGNVLDANSRAPQVGWAGQTITSFRFDPNEDPGANQWYLKSVNLHEDPAATGSTTIRFHDAAWVSGTTAIIQVGTGAPGTPYTTIASNVAVASGINSVPFDLGGMPSGSYRVLVILQHPNGGGALKYSTTPVTMTRNASNDPRGSLDDVTRVIGGIHVRGWAFDADSASPIGVHIYVDGTFATSFTTDTPRGDVKSVFAAAPTNSGYDRTVSVGAGTHNVCAYGINVGDGSNALLGCKTITVDGSPSGSLDQVVAMPGGINVNGWAIDPDTTGPIRVDVYAGGSGNSTTANLTRGDVGAAFPGFGANHGFRLDLPRPAGTYQVCAYAINTPSGANPVLGCKSVTVGRAAPIGSLDEVTRSGGQVTARGWAIDGDTYSAIRVAIYVNGQGAAVVPASQDRGDIAAAYPNWGAQHGFLTTVAAPPGATVCAYAIDDSGAAANTLIGCRTA